MDYLEEQYDTGPPGPMYGIRMELRRVLPPEIRDEIEQHPRLLLLLEKMGIDYKAQDKLMNPANGLTQITGIHVQPQP